VLSRTQKESQIEELRGKLQRAKSVFLVDFRGLPVGAQNQLRGRMRSEGEGDFEYQVAKNTLLRRAVDGSEAAPLADQFVGPTAIAISYGDPVGLAKILVDYEKQYEIFSVKGGLVEGATVAREEIATLATLPTLDALRGKIVGLLQAPATKLAQLLQAPGSQVARVVAAREKQLAESGDTA
jgi:large subunit ribosomal protein L10